MKTFIIPVKRVSKRLLWLGILLLLLAGKSFAQQYYTLQQVLDSIDRRNPGLEQYAWRTQSSNAMGAAAKAWDAPSAGAGLSEFPYSSRGKMADGAGPRKMIMLRFQQMFPNFGRQKKETAWYQSYASQDRDERATMKNMLFSRAKMAYYDIYVAQKKLTVLSEQEKQLQLLIRIAEGRLAYNKASLPNIYKARAKLSDLQSMRIELQSMSDQAVAILNSLMNRPQDASLQIDSTMDPGGKSLPVLQADSAYVLANRSDIRHTADAIHTMQLKQEMVSQMRKPMFGLTWDNMRMNSGMYMYNVMAMVTIPLAPWFSKGYRSEIRAMDDEVSAMRKMKEGQVLEAIGNIRKDWLDLQSARHDLQVFRDEVIPAYAKTYQANLNAFSENTGDIYETMMAWDELTMKKMASYDKLARVLDKQVLLEMEMQQY